MSKGWFGKKNILCIRLDNMGDVIMSTPAMRALKETFQCNITLLTSTMAAGVAPYIGVDDVIVSNVPWVKLEKNDGVTGYLDLITTLKGYHFDAAVIFTVFSQNPMPAIMLAYLAGIPSRLAYCRENPYELLTDWVPDQEPYTFVRHQVTRDLDLVAAVGAKTYSTNLNLTVPQTKLDQKIHIKSDEPWIVVHPSASEKKREYPTDKLIEILNKIAHENILLIFTGVEKEQTYINNLIKHIDGRCISLAGKLKLEEFIALIHKAPTLLSVNSGPVHIAAALKTPVVVLYALTNPQHTPWNTENKVFTFAVEEDLKSKNEVLKYVDEHILDKRVGWPDSSEVASAVIELMQTAFSQHSQPIKNRGS